MTHCRTLILMIMLIAVAAVPVNGISAADATNWSNLVMKYNSTVTVPVSVESYLDVDISIDGPAANYTYAFILIHEDAYEANIGAINVTSDGTSAGTNFTINGTKIDIDLVNGNQTQLINLLNDIFGPDNNDMLLKQYIQSNSTSGNFEGLDAKNPGHYLVFTAVLSSENYELVAFNQTIVTIGTLTGDVNGDGILSSVDALMALQMTVGNIAQDLAADVSGDGSVTSLDALMILQASVGAIAL